MAINKVVYGSTTLIDLTNDTVASEKMLQGTTAHGADGSAITGSIAINSSGDIGITGPTISVPSGCYSEVTDITVPAGAFTSGENIPFLPSISVDNNGLITISQSTSTYARPVSKSGYFQSFQDTFKISIASSSTYQLDTQSAQTITPASVDQTIAAGRYLTGVQTISGDSNLVAANIKQGITIFGIEGTAKTEPVLQSKSATPTEAQQNIVADTDYDGLSSVTVNAIDSSYVGSNVIRRSSTDLSASGSVVTVPSGYYAAAVSKAVAAGSATTPATIITTNPAITLNTATGVISAAAAASKSITPTIASGYISSGNAGVVTVSGSSNFQLPVKAAATYIPTTTDQTIAAGQYLTGAQTVKGDPKLVSENIVFDESIFGVQGSFGTDFIVVGNHGLYFKNFDINNNVLISEKGTVTGNTLVLT